MTADLRWWRMTADWRGWRMTADWRWRRMTTALEPSAGPGTPWRRRPLLLAGLALLIVPRPARADASTQTDAAETAAAEARIQSLADWAETVLSQPDLSATAARNAFAGIVDEAFDLHRVARFVLGRHWPEASPDERARFEALVRREIVEGFGRNLSQLRGRSLTIAESRWRGPGDVDVSTRVAGPGLPPLPVTFRLQRGGGPTLRIVDIQLLGFSLLTAQRQAVDARVQSFGDLSAMLDAVAP